MKLTSIFFAAGLLFASTAIAEGPRAAATRKAHENANKGVTVRDLGPVIPDPMDRSGNGGSGDRGTDMGETRTSRSMASGSRSEEKPEKGDRVSGKGEETYNESDTGLDIGQGTNHSDTSGR